MNEPIHFDNAATSHPKPECVYRAVDHFLRHVGASPLLAPAGGLPADRGGGDLRFVVGLGAAQRVWLSWESVSAV